MTKFMKNIKRICLFGRLIRARVDMKPQSRISIYTAWDFARIFYP